MYQRDNNSTSECKSRRRMLQKWCLWPYMFEKFT